MDLTFGLAVSAINWALLISVLLCRRPALSPRLISVFALTLILLCIPVAGVTPIYYLRGVVGEFSITATLILAVMAFRKRKTIT